MKNKHTFTYKIIGNPPPGLLPGSYLCEFRELKIKGGKSLITLEVKKEEPQK